MTAAQLSRRETAKAERRQRIVSAAAALVRRLGFAQVAMTDIAQAAGVSPGTLYNLFQTKAAIFKQLADDDLAAYERLVDQASATDALDRLFVGLRVAAALYAAEPDFYRALFRIREPADPLVAAIDEPRVAYLQRRVREAVAEGRLRADTNADVVGVVLAHAMRGCIIDWTSNGLSAARLEVEAAYAFAVVLLAFVATPWEVDLRARADRLGRRLAAEPR